MEEKYTLISNLSFRFTPIRQSLCDDKTDKPKRRLKVYKQRAGGDMHYDPIRFIRINPLYPEDRWCWLNAPVYVGDLMATETVTPGFYMFGEVKDLQFDRNSRLEREVPTHFQLVGSVLLPTATLEEHRPNSPYVHMIIRTDDYSIDVSALSRDAAAETEFDNWDDAKRAITEQRDRLIDRRNFLAQPRYWVHLASPFLDDYDNAGVDYEAPGKEMQTDDGFVAVPDPASPTGWAPGRASAYPAFWQSIAWAEKYWTEEIPATDPLLDSDRD